MDSKESSSAGIMPTYRDLFPQSGAVGENKIKKILQSISLRDCLVILIKFSRLHYKYVQRGRKDLEKYNVHCRNLFDEEINKRLDATEKKNQRQYTIFIPELSVLHLARLALRYCDNSKYTADRVFPNSLLFHIGKCLLIVNSLLGDEQLRGVGQLVQIDEQRFMVNMLKYLIVDHNFDVLQQLYRNYFLYCNFFQKYKNYIDIEQLFQNRYRVSAQEYVALMFLVYSTFRIKDDAVEDDVPPWFDFYNPLKNLRPQFKDKLLIDLVLPSSKYKHISTHFFDVISITQQPLVKLKDGKVMPMSLKRLFSRITDSVYYDILDNLPNEKIKNKFSTYFGKVIEDYIFEITQNINRNAFPDTNYWVGKKRKNTPDSIIPEDQGLIFIESKKRNFHTKEFINSADFSRYSERLKEFYYKPLEKLCKVIRDFRDGLFCIKNLSGCDHMIYPMIVSPVAPPLLPGGWDKFNLYQYILPGYFDEDSSVARPEFLGLDELEQIEEYLRLHPEISFIELIKEKQSDPNLSGRNWVDFLYNTGRSVVNRRLLDKYMAEAEKFKKLLFV